MKTRVEFIAIPAVLLLLGGIFALMLAAEAGVWAWLIVTTALVLVGLLAIAIVIARHRHPPAFDAPSTSPTTSASGAYRVLVIADDSLSRRAVREEIVPHASGRRVEALVIAPELRSRLAHWTGDDSDRGDAERHLGETLSGLEGAGVAASGMLGSDDPIQAADDGLRRFPADEVVFVTGRDSNWLERDLLAVARERYAVPITHVGTET